MGRLNCQEKDEDHRNSVSCITLGDQESDPRKTKMFAKPSLSQTRGKKT